MDASKRSNSNVAVSSIGHGTLQAPTVAFTLQPSSSSSSLSVENLRDMEEGRNRPAYSRFDSVTSNTSLTQVSNHSLNRSFSSHLRMSRKNLNVDEDILHRAAADAGLGSMGTVYVEVWTLDPDGTQLSRPDGGYWMDPVFHNSEAECGCCGTLKCSACKISDPDHPNFIPADPVAPGVGLAGVLWSESATVEDTAVVGGLLKDTTKQRKVVWRDLRAMANNPHLPYDERLKAIVDCGLGWAAGVPFHVNHHKGIVIYAARGSVDQSLLKETSNEQYLLCAADLIGSAWALREPRRAAMASRKAKREAAIRRARLKIITLIRMGVKFDQPLPSNDPKKAKEKIHPEGKKANVVSRVVKAKAAQTFKSAATVVKKCKGSNNKPPPPFSNDQAVFTFVGSFMLLTLLAGIGHVLVTDHGKDYLLLLPPFGAFVCLQFGLTQAPAAQPRNCLVGQVLSISIALLVSLIPLLPVWFKQALGTSLAIAVMTRCGVTHPPAGASAFLFSSGLYGITHMALLLAGNVVAILVGSVINNTSEKRQYPTYIAMGLNPADMLAYLKR